MLVLVFLLSVLLVLEEGHAWFAIFDIPHDTLGIVRIRHKIFLDGDLPDREEHDDQQGENNALFPVPFKVRHADLHIIDGIKQGFEP